MRIVKTQRILYNSEYRIRLISDNDDAEYMRLVRKLPDCRWSNHLNSWHTNNISNHIHHFNRAFPSHIRFYDVSVSPCTLKIQEPISEKRIRISRDSKGNNLIAYFLYDHDLESLIKKVGGLPEPACRNSWMLRNFEKIPGSIQSYLDRENYRIDYINTQNAETVLTHSFKAENESVRSFGAYLKSMNYGERTINQYCSNIQRYLMSCKNKGALDVETMRDYLDEMAIRKRYSRSYQNLHINSIKAYYNYASGKQLEKNELPRPRWEQSIPQILTKQEILRLINLIPNSKHQTLISAIYMTGITVNEAISIKAGDVDRNNMQILIRARNETNFRIIPIPLKLHSLFESYLAVFKPQNYFFEGSHGKKYSERNIQKIIKKCGLNSGIGKKTTARTLRHSFAGHKVDEGMDIEELQKFLGHKSRKSTEKYYGIKYKMQI